MEYLYKESINPEEIKEHLKVCQSCHERYLDLKRDMESISDHFKPDFWRTQRKGIMSQVSQMQEVKDSSWVKWLRPAFVTIILIILFIGIYSRLNHTPIRYTEKDMSDDIFLEYVSELADQPLTSALDYLNFQEEEDQEENGTYSFEKLEIFGYWPELEA
jgi:hypothetical protein